MKNIREQLHKIQKHGNPQFSNIKLLSVQLLSSNF